MIPLENVDLRQATIDRILYILDTGDDRVNIEQWTELVQTYLKLSKIGLNYVYEAKTALIEAGNSLSKNSNESKGISKLINYMNLLTEQVPDAPIIEVENEDIGYIVPGMEFKINVSIKSNNIPSNINDYSFQTYTDGLIVTSEDAGQGIYNYSFTVKVPYTANTSTNNKSYTATVKARLINSITGIYSEWSKSLEFEIYPYKIIGFIEKFNGLCKRIGSPIAIENSEWARKASDRYPLSNGFREEEEQGKDPLTKMLNTPDYPHGNMKVFRVTNKGDILEWDPRKYDETTEQLMTKIIGHYYIDGIISPNGGSNLDSFYIKVVSKYPFIINIPKILGIEYNSLVSYNFIGRGNTLAGNSYNIEAIYSSEFYVGSMLCSQQNSILGSFYKSSGFPVKSANSNRSHLGVLEGIQAFMTTDPKNTFAPINFEEHQTLLRLFACERGFLGNIFNNTPLQEVRVGDNRYYSFEFTNINSISNFNENIKFKRVKFSISSYTLMQALKDFEFEVEYTLNDKLYGVIKFRASNIKVITSSGENTEFENQLQDTVNIYFKNGKKTLTCNSFKLTQKNIKKQELFYQYPASVDTAGVDIDVDATRSWAKTGDTFNRYGINKTPPIYTTLRLNQTNAAVTRFTYRNIEDFSSNFNTYIGGTYLTENTANSNSLFYKDRNVINSYNLSANNNDTKMLSNIPNTGSIFISSINAGIILPSTSVATSQALSHINTKMIIPASLNRGIKIPLYSNIHPYHITWFALPSGMEVSTLTAAQLNKAAVRNTFRARI